ncbi:MAG: phytanoyl-CoA dioxygenase family protein, partial [Acidobacteriota bacterium]
YKSYQDSPTWISNLTADLKYTLNQATVTTLVDKYGIIAPKGPAGSVFFFHGNIVHGSPNNISPFDRLLIIITFSSIDNIPKRSINARPEFLASRDYAPLTPILDEEL